MVVLLPYGVTCLLCNTSSIVRLYLIMHYVTLPLTCASCTYNNFITGHLSKLTLAAEVSTDFCALSSSVSYMHMSEDFE